MMLTGVYICWQGSNESLILGTLCKINIVCWQKTFLRITICNKDFQWGCWCIGVVLPPGWGNLRGSLLGWSCYNWHPASNESSANLQIIWRVLARLGIPLVSRNARAQQRLSPFLDKNWHQLKTLFHLLEKLDWIQEELVQWSGRRWTHEYLLILLDHAA